MSALNIKKGDTVYVLSGRSHTKRLNPEEVERTPATELKHSAERHAGKRGKVMKVIPSSGRLIVEGVNILTKHNKRGRTGRAAQIQAGRLEQPGVIDMSNVMLVCPRCDRPTRVRHEVHEDKRVRVCHKCNEIIDRVR